MSISPRRSNSRGRLALRTPQSSLISSGASSAVASLANMSPNPFVRGAARLAPWAKAAYRYYRAKNRVRKAVRQGSKKSYGIFTGTYKGRIVRKRALKRKKHFQSYSVNGNVFRFEMNGNISDKQCVYIGHSVGFNPFIHGVTRAILQTLFTKADQPIPTWEGTSKFSFRLKWNYRQEYDYSKINVIDQVFSSGLVWKLIGDYIYDGNSALTPAVTGLKSQFSGAKISDNLNFYSVSLYNEATPTQPMATIYFDNYAIKYKVTSTMDVQNLTTADWVDNTATGASTLALADNIFNNPLKGFLYSNRGKGNKWSNGFMELSLDNIGGNTKKIDPVTLLNDAGSADTYIDLHGSKVGLIAQVGINMPVKFQKPMYAWGFEGKIKTASVIINPGEIKKDGWKFQGFQKFNNFLQSHGSRFAEGFDNRSATTATKHDNKWAFGNAHMLGLEKLLDYKSSEEKNQIKVGFEINCVYAIKLVKVKSKKAMPFIWVQKDTVNANTIDAGGEHDASIVNETGAGGHGL